MEGQPKGKEGEGEGATGGDGCLHASESSRAIAVIEFMLCLPQMANDSPQQKPLTPEKM